MPKIRRYEREYWSLLSIESVVIPENKAQEAITKLESAVTVFESEIVSDNDNYSPEIISLLQEIKADLNNSSKTASAKLKVTLPLIPMIASYELEADTEGLVYEAWKFIKRIVGR